MSAFQRGDDSFNLSEKLDRLHRRAIGRRRKLDSTQILEIAQLGSDARIVQSGSDRMGLADLSGIILQDVALAAMQHTDLAAKDRGRVLAASQPASGCLDTDHPHISIVYERVKQSHGVAAAADACNQAIRESAFLL